MDPEIVCVLSSVLLVNATVPLLWEKVPAVCVKSLPIEKVPDGAVKLPVVSVKVPFTVSAVVEPPTLNVCPAVLFTVRLLKVWDAAVPLMALELPVNVTVPEPGVNVPPLLAQSPTMEIVCPFAASVPLATVIVPASVSPAAG